MVSLVRSFSTDFYTIISGVVNSKWHKKKKVSPQDRLLISKTSEEADYTKREAVFSSHREDLCVEFRFAFLYLRIRKIKILKFLQV